VLKNSADLNLPQKATANCGIVALVRVRPLQGRDDAAQPVAREVHPGHTALAKR
jgi:hypothetical protein